MQVMESRKISIGDDGEEGKNASVPSETVIHAEREKCCAVAVLSDPTTHSQRVALPKVFDAALPNYAVIIRQVDVNPGINGSSVVKPENVGQVTAQGQTKQEGYQKVEEQPGLRKETEHQQRLKAKQRARQHAARLQEEAARRAHYAEQEALRLEKEAAVTSQHVVLGSTLVTFGAGLEIQGVISGFDSCRIIIKNIPTNAKPHDIVDLFAQQGISRHEVHILSIQPADGGLLNATVLASASGGGIAAVGLDGIEYGNENLLFEIGEIVSTNAMGESNGQHANTLTISWSAPSLSVIATYFDQESARTKQRTLDKTVVSGRRIKAEMNQPPTGPALRYYNPASVKLTRLPVTMPSEEIQELAGTLSIRNIKSNTYNLQELLKDLRQHIDSLPDCKLSTFTISPHDFEGIVTVKVHFEKWESANHTRESLEGKRLRPDYPTFRLSLPAPYHFTSTIPVQQYEAQKQRWDSLSESNAKDGPSIYINRFANGARVNIRLLGNDRKLVGALKVRAETLIAGENLDASCWHRSFLSAKGREFLGDVYTSTKVFVRSDFKTQSLKIYGEGDAKQRARQMIEEEVAELARREWSVPLKRQCVGYFVREGLAALKEILGNESVTLDLTSNPCKLTLCGGEEGRHALNTIMDQALNDRNRAYAGSGDACPICYDEISNPIKLGCNHVYCTACIRHYLVSAQDTKIFPLVCMGDEAQCKKPISIPTIQRFLIQQQYERLIDAAFSSYLNQHPQDFRYCTTPDCTQIYRANTKTMLKCPSCFAEICSSCHEEAHDGMSCEERRIQKSRTEEQLNDHWATMHGVKKCPSCSVYIEKIEGCNHMTCHCGAHICWICVEEFPHHEIYRHLTTVHGGAYDGDGERRNRDAQFAFQLQQAENNPAPRLHPWQAEPAPAPEIEHGDNLWHPFRHQFQEAQRRRVEEAQHLVRQIQERRMQEENLARRQREEEQLRVRRAREAEQRHAQEPGWGCIVM
ncbi:hypothetical protein H0H92_010803 [Tricholoma furcatifolium]|nr:hypothetical protein H0H92_010803 [Tricholoma furcatifolium]